MVATVSRTATATAANPQRSLWATFLIGAGATAAVDEIIFHQLLAWHHFYDGSTGLVALMSDGFLHAAELIALFTGFFMVWNLLRRGSFSRSRGWAGFFLGAGIFQMFDGIIDHKVLRLHQIRYGIESIVPYDIAWNAAGLVLFLIGAALLWRAQQAKVP